jgi:hypothetical protein
MLIDCDTCVARDVACGECVIGVLMRSPAVPLELDDDEQAAIGSLARAGLVPPLRLVRGVSSDSGDSSGDVRGIA